MYKLYCGPNEPRQAWRRDSILPCLLGAADLPLVLLLRQHPGGRAPPPPVFPQTNVGAGQCLLVRHCSQGTVLVGGWVKHVHLHWFSALKNPIFTLVSWAAL